MNAEKNDFISAVAVLNAYWPAKVYYLPKLNTTAKQQKTLNNTEQQKNIYSLLS